MTDTHHLRLTGEGQGGMRKVPQSCAVSFSPPQHLPASHSISGPWSGNAPRIWRGGRALFGWTYRKYTNTNTRIDVWLVRVKFLLCNKTIEQPLLKPGDHLFPFLALPCSITETPTAATRAGSISSSPGRGEKGGNRRVPLSLELLTPLLAAVGQILRVFPPRVAAGETERRGLEPGPGNAGPARGFL